MINERGEVSFTVTLEGEPELVKDETGYAMTRAILVERLTAYETTRCYENCQQGDFEGLAYVMGEGCYGFNEMTDGELATEWADAEEGFWDCYDNNRLVIDLDEMDPLSITSQEQPN